MIVLYYYKLKADPEHISYSLGKGDLPMSRKSAAGWNQVYCCFFNDLSGKGNINILRIREGNSGEGAKGREGGMRESLSLCELCVCCDPQCKEQALQLFY